MKIKQILLILLLISPATVWANFDFNANCLKAYQQIFELKLSSARQLVSIEKKIHPNNSIVPLLENYIDYFYLLSTDNKQDFERLEVNKSKRIDQISSDETDSPYSLYAQAEINLQWALIRGRYGSYFAAAREIKKASSLLVENNRKFPAFHLNAKGLGLIQAVMGSLPDGFLKSALSTFGITGNVDKGLSMLDKLAENLPKSAYEPFFEEVVFYYSYVLNDVVHSPSAYAKTMKFTSRFTSNSLLKTYLQAYSAVKNGQNDQAIAILNARPVGIVYQSFPYLDYLMGVAKLNRLDYSAAGSFDKYLQNNKGVSYIKDSYLHLAWVALLKGDNAGYSAAIAKVKTSGYVYQDKDRQALNEAEAAIPNKLLLSTRLLFDGGYLVKANELLSNVSTDSFNTLKDKAEFNYRLGRINDDLGKDELALINYKNAINYGKALKQYFAAKAAVLTAKIYERRKDRVKAISYFNMAIDFKDHDYENSIENEAKQGLKRMGKN